MSRVQTRKVTPDEADLRLDRWFKLHFPDLPFGRLSKLMRTGQVRVNGKRAHGSCRLQAGDEVRIPPLDDRPAVKPPRALKPREKNDIERLVIYRDPDFMVLNKPAGLAVQGGSGTKEHVDRLLPALQGKNDEKPPRLVHRLDKDTSGLLLVARSAKSARFFTRAFKDKTVKKVYWALVRGVPKPPAGKINAALDKSKGAKEVMEVREDGKAAQTLYQVIDHAGDEIAWVALSPLTGRTHQLRVHMAHIGHPILGDGKYGGRDARFRELPTKLHLHAAALSFPLPGGGRTVISAPLPPHMKTSFDFFGFEPAAVADPFEGFSLDQA